MATTHVTRAMGLWAAMSLPFGCGSEKVPDPTIAGESEAALEGAACGEGVCDCWNGHNFDPALRGHCVISTKITGWQDSRGWTCALEDLVRGWNEACDDVCRGRASDPDNEDSWN